MNWANATHMSHYLFTRPRCSATLASESITDPTSLTLRHDPAHAHFPIGLEFRGFRRDYSLVGDGDILARGVGKTRKQTALRPSKQSAAPRAHADHFRRHGWRLIALGALVLAAYSNSFHAALIFDNAAIIGQDTRIRAATLDNIALILKHEYWYPSATSGLYRPITTFSYLVNYAVLGNELRPAGYHAVNLALHLINVALVYALGIAIFGGPAWAMMLAALWGLHPLLTESVTNIVGRADLLAAFGVLAGLLSSVRYAAAEVRHKLAWLAGIGLAQMIGIFSKESAAMLPGILLLYDLTVARQMSWRDRWPTYAALALPFGIFSFLRAASHASMHIVWSENPLVGAGFFTARLTAVKIVGKFLWLFLCPLRLSADYSYNAVPLFSWGGGGWGDLQTVAALAVCATAVALCVRWRRTSTAFFIAFFFAALAPVSNLIVFIGSIMAERFIYLPSVGLAGCAVSIIRAVSREYSSTHPITGKALPAAVGLVCLTLAARTYARNLDWHDDLTLWTSTVSSYPQSARAHNNLGNALSLVPGRLPNAIVELETALRIRPDYAEAHYNLGNAFAHTPGRLDEAIDEFRAALRFPPDFGKLQHDANTHVNLGNVLARTDQLPEAIAEYHAAIRVRPDLAEAHYDLGNLLARIPGQIEQAVAELRIALQITPDLAEAHYSLGSILLRMPGHAPDAIAEFETALRIRPDPQLRRFVDQLHGATRNN